MTIKVIAIKNAYLCHWQAKCLDNIMEKTKIAETQVALMEKPRSNGKWWKRESKGVTFGIYLEEFTSKVMVD